MNPKIIACVAFIAATMATAAHAQFKLDQSDKEVRKVQDVMAIDDLAIDETGLLTYATFCRVGDVLFLPGSNILQSEPSAYGVNYRVTRKQNNTVSIEAKPGEKLDSFQKALLTAITIAIQHQCDTFDVGPDKRFQVLSINGAASISDIEKTLK